MELDRRNFVKLLGALFASTAAPPALLAAVEPAPLPLVAPPVDVLQLKHLYTGGLAPQDVHLDWVDVAEVLDLTIEVEPLEHYSRNQDGTRRLDNVVILDQWANIFLDTRTANAALWTEGREWFKFSGREVAARLLRRSGPKDYLIEMEGGVHCCGLSERAIELEFKFRGGQITEVNRI